MRAASPATSRTCRLPTLLPRSVASTVAFHVVTTAVASAIPPAPNGL